MIHQPSSNPINASGTMLMGHACQLAGSVAGPVVDHGHQQDDDRRQFAQPGWHGSTRPA